MSRDHLYPAPLPVACCLLLLAASALALPGCSAGPTRAAPVDPARAREALTSALDRWQKGDALASLKSGSPAITVQDMDWERGCKLVRYEILEDGKNDDANLLVPVRLTLQEPGGGSEVVKEVRYVVGTSPSITVFREWL